MADINMVFGALLICIPQLSLIMRAIALSDLTLPWAIGVTYSNSLPNARLGYKFQKRVWTTLSYYDKTVGDRFSISL